MLGFVFIETFELFTYIYTGRQLSNNLFRNCHSGGS
jgi:hypothetical protein